MMASLFIFLVLEFLLDFREFFLKVGGPTTERLFLLAESCGDMRHGFVAQLRNKYPDGQDATINESIKVLAWRLINPMPDAPHGFAGHINV